MDEYGNKDRAFNIEKILTGCVFDVYECDEVETVLVDMVADLMHYCFQNDVNFDDILRIAANHFDQELIEERVCEPCLK